MSKFTEGFKNLLHIEKKALPTQALTTVQTYISAPLPLAHSARDLVNLNTGYVYICNQKNAAAVANAKLRLYTTKKVRGDWVKAKSIDKYQTKWLKDNTKNYQIKSAKEIVEIEEHPVFDLLYRVNEMLDVTSLMEITEQYCGLIGSAFWLLIKDKRIGLPTEIRVLPSEYVSLKLDTEGMIVGYVLQPDLGLRVEYEPNDVIQFRNIAAGGFRRLNSFSSLSLTSVYGMGHLEACVDEAVLMKSINTYQRSLSDNMGRPDMVIAYKGGNLDDKTKQDLYRQWNNVFKGAKNAGKIQISDGDLTIQNLGWAPRDLEFENGKIYLRNTIANCFGVPIELVSPDSNSKATSLVAIENYNVYTVLPKLRKYSEALNQNLLPLYDDSLFFAYDDPNKSDPELLLRQEQNDIKNGVLSINEIRTQRGIEPYPEPEYDRPIWKEVKATGGNPQALQDNVAQDNTQEPQDNQGV